MLLAMRFVISLIVLAGLAVSMWLPASALELDRRRMLTAAEHVPWRAVGRVNIGTTRSLSMCTGTLIGEDLVLTAGHCVYSYDTGGSSPVDIAAWADSINVFPGFDNRGQCLKMRF